jgi:SEC-C motif-containing protein
MWISQPCPCGTGTGYDECCGPLHRGERPAETAEQLMRSRYAAFARGDGDYVFRTWHPRTRPSDVRVDGDVVWTGLEVTDTVAGGLHDETGEVEFTASFTDGVMHERSRFERRAGRWLYVDGDVG